MGTPYALIQKVKAPIRTLYQLPKLAFFPIIKTEEYKGWKDLDGQPMYTHARGSGTEAIMNLRVIKKSAKYASMSYVPGSAVRADVWLIDEPFSAVDEQTRRPFQEDLLRLLAKENKTAIFVTHRIEDAAYVTDQIVLLSPRPGRKNRIVVPGRVGGHGFYVFA